MSKVTITIDLDRYICTELEDVREMIKTLDFSGLSAAVERIQKHANAMESALHHYNNTFHDIEKVFDENKRDEWDGSKNWVLKTPTNKLDKIKELVSNRKNKDH